MSKTYRVWNPRQSWLLPPSPQDWMPEGDLVYFLMDVVETLDISSITAVYEKSVRGFPPFHPRMMLCLLIYSYAMGVRSSRQIAQRCQRDVGWRVIVGEDIPDCRTISGFRKMHLPAFSALFLEVLGICQAAGLVSLGHLALDGSKVKANASRHKAMSYGRMVAEELRLKGEIATLLQEAESQDAAEDALLGAAEQANKLPEELARRETRLQRIQKAKAQLEARYKNLAEGQPAIKSQVSAAPSDHDENNDDSSGSGDQATAAAKSPDLSRDTGVAAVVPEKAQINFTDPESRIMKANNKGWDQCGNAQVVVDSAGQIIVAADITDQANDMRQVLPMMLQAQQNVGEDNRIEKASMDAGYFSEDNVQWLEKQGIDAYVATGRLKHGVPVPLAPRGRIPEHLSIKDRMARKLRTVQGKAIYARRKAVVEPVFGQIKQAMGCRQFLLRGLRKMQGEWKLIFLVFNLRKLFRAKQVSRA